MTSFPQLFIIPQRILRTRLPHPEAQKYLELCNKALSHIVPTS